MDLKVAAIDTIQKEWQPIFMSMGGMRLPGIAVGVVA